MLQKYYLILKKMLTKKQVLTNYLKESLLTVQKTMIVYEILKSKDIKNIFVFLFQILSFFEICFLKI